MLKSSLCNSDKQILVKIVKITGAEGAGDQAVRASTKEANERDKEVVKTCRDIKEERKLLHYSLTESAKQILAEQIM